MGEERIILICQPAEPDAAVVPGSVQRDCTQCGTKVWMAPSGQKQVDKESATIICLPCGLAMMKKVPGPVKITPESLQEIQAWRRRN